jgi:hypothetical protein
VACASGPVIAALRRRCYHRLLSTPLPTRPGPRGAHDPAAPAERPAGPSMPSAVVERPRTARGEVGAHEPRPVYRPSDPRPRDARGDQWQERHPVQHRDERCCVARPSRDGPGEQARVRDRPRSAAMGPVELPGIRSPAERRSDYRRVPPSRSTVPVGVPSVLQSC